MFKALSFFISNSNNKVITKDEVRTAAEAVFTALAKSVYPATKDILASDEYFSSEDSKLNLLLNIGGSLGVHTTNPKDVVKALSEFYKDVIVEEKNFIKLVDDNLNDKIFVKMATAQELAIMKTISDLSSVALYSLDIFYSVIAGEDTSYPEKKESEVRDGIHNFVSIVRVYMDKFDKHVKNLSKVAKSIIDTTAPPSLVDKMLSRHGKLVTMPILNGFTNNPIYHIRLWFASRDVEKYESLKEKKKLIELKVLELKMAAEGKHDGRIDKQIKYYEDKIVGMEYDIRDIESDLD